MGGGGRAFDALDAAVTGCAGLACDTLSVAEQFELLERVEVVRRRLPAR